MLTKLTLKKPALRTPSTVKTLPSRALANYAKASQSTDLETLDKVTLSEQAKAKPQSTSSLRKLGTFVALGLSFVGIFGAAGCSGGAAATDAQAEVQSVQDTVKQTAPEVELRQEAPEASAPSQDILTEVGREGKRIKDSLKGKSAEEIAETVGQEGRKVGEQAIEELKSEGRRLKETFQGKNAEEVAETIGQEGRKLGRQIGEEGKKIGQEAAKVGKEVGNVAKGFWRGLTGKKKN